jgi:hypothetical protein
MSPWSFVIAAYALAILLTLVLTADSFIRMRRAERAADALRRK